MEIGNIVAYKRYGDYTGGALTGRVWFGVVVGTDTRDIEGFDGFSEWIIIVAEDGSHKRIIPSQVVRYFKDEIG
jgi:hypothetical protein